MRGRLVAPAGQPIDWSRTTWSSLDNLAAWAEQPPSNLAGRDVQFWLVDYYYSEAGQRICRTKAGVSLKVGRDGSFESTEAVAPGEYKLRCFVANHRVERQVTITAPAENWQSVCDLGEIPLSQ